MPRYEQGIALITSMLMLLVLTVLALSAMRDTDTNLRVARNEQLHNEAERAAQRAIEGVIADAHNYYDASTTVDNTDNLSAIECVSDDAPVTDDNGRFSKGMTNAPENTAWELTGEYSDDATGAEATVVQGVTMQIPKGRCD